MKSLLTHIFYFTKRQLKQVPFLLLLLLFPLCIAAFTHINHTEDTTIRVALYTDSDSGATAPLIENLLHNDGNIHFYVCEDKASVYTDVAVGHAECGYLIPSTLYDSLDQKHKSNLIEVIESPSTVLSHVINEVVYAKIFNSYALHLLKEYITTDSPFADSSILSDIIAKTDSLYYTHMTDQSTFHFDYTATYQAQTLQKQVLLSPIRGFIALFIFLAGFCGCINYYNDKENHIFDNRALSARFQLQILSILIPALLTTLMGYICLFFADLITQPLYEIAALLLYNFLVLLFMLVLSHIVKQKVLFTSTISIFCIGSLLFTPVFIDVTAYLPILKPLQLCFLPYYYLAFF